MTRIVILVVVLTTTVIKSYGCDACGCSFSGLGIGMLSGYENTYFGISLQSAHYTSTKDHTPSIHDQLHLMEWSIRVRLASRWHVQANIPFRFNQRTEPGYTGSKKGLSDGRISGYYRVLSQKSIGKDAFLTLEAGAGLLLPIGRYEYDLVHTQKLPDNFSLGYGAWAPTLHLNAILTQGNHGLVMSGQHLHYLANTQGITFGAQTFLRAVVFHNSMLGSGWILSPFAGAQLEMQGWNRNAENLRMADTQGYALSLPAGLSLDRHPWVVNFSGILPIKQSFASGTMLAKPKFQAQLLFAF